MSLNGRLPDSALAGVPGGRLAKNAAAAWNAGPARAGCRPLGPNSSYRTFAAQVFFWNLWKSGHGNLAAFPGTSNHGWGMAIDLQAPWMRQWIDAHGSRYGWKKVEAPGEWWHVNYVGGFVVVNPLRRLNRKQRKAAERLLYHRREAIREATSSRGRRWHRHVRWRKHWRDLVLQMYRSAHGRQKHVLRRVLNDRDGRL